MPAVQVDQQSAGTLAQAKAEALSSLRESMPGFSPLAGAKAAPAQARGAQDPDLAALDAQAAPGPTQEAIEGNEGIIPGIPSAPGPSPALLDKHAEDNGEIGYSSAMHFLRDTFKGTGAEVTNAIPRAAARIGGWLTNAAAGAVFLGDKGQALFTGKDKAWADHVFNFKKDFVDSAVEHWIPDQGQAAQTGQGTGTGGAAQVIGHGAEVIPAIATGGAGMLAQVLQSSTDSAMNDVDQGRSIKQALADGTVDGIANYVTMKFGMRAGPSILKRVISSIGIGDLIHMTSNVLKGGLNKAFGDPNAPTPSIFEGLDENTIQSAIFGALAGKGHTTLADKGQATGRAPSAAPAPPPSPEAVAAASGQTTSATPVAPAASTVPDTPSVEPLKDIKAQFADMNSKLTPRTGVLVTPETQTHITALGDKTVDLAKKQGRTIDLPQGTLVLKTKNDVIKANQRLKYGEDPQAVIGSVTGAGSGKSPDATAVVQGHDQDGAVATETAVHPADVPLAVQKVEDQGKNPVITTPAEAVARRVDERNKEVQGTPIAPDAPVSPHRVEQAAQPVATEPVAKSEAEPTHESEETPAAPEPKMGIFKALNGKEQPVHIEEGAPDGKVRVRPIDAQTGEPAGRTIDVPADRVRQSHQDESASAPPAKPASKAATAMAREAETPSPSVENAHANEQPTSTLNAEKVADVGKAAAREEIPAEITSKAKVEAQAQPEATPARRSDMRIDPNDLREVAPENRRSLTTIAHEEGGSRLAAAVKALRESYNEPPPARKPTTALEILPEALKTHEKQEVPEEGKKFAGSLAERQDNASAFASVLGKAAEEARGKSPDADVERAAKAAKAAVGLTLKSKNATDKGQGTSHTHITAVVDEMHRAARVLMEKGSEEDKQPAMAPKAAAVKRRIALKKQADEKAATKPAKVEETAADVVAKETKRSGISPKDQIRTNKYIHEFLHSDFSEHAETESKLREHLAKLADEYGDSFPRGQIDTYMRFLTEQRNDLNEGKNTGRMSDTVEQEESEFERPENGFETTYRPQIEEGPGAKARTVAARHRLNVEWANTSDNLQKSGFFDALDRFRDNGEPLGSHFLLDKLIENTHTPILRTLLTEVRGRVPDSPVYNRSTILHMKTGAQIGGGKAAGVYHASTNTIQFNFIPEEGFRPFQIRGLVHEMIHAGTVSELAMNPHGELAARMDTALDVLKQRLASKYGEDKITNWVNYFQDRTGSVARPEGESLRHLYGITNTHELATEILTNPDFIREVAESEGFASPREALLPGKASLLTRIFKAIGEFFGIKDAKLLQHIVDTTFETMDAQRTTRPSLYGKRAETFHAVLPPEIHAALEGRPLDQAVFSHAMQLIEEPAPPLRGVEGKMAEAIGPENDIRETTREFAHVFKSRAADGLRRTVIALKTVGQLYRDHMKDFGHDDGTNPLRRVQETDMEKEHIIQKLRDISRPAALKWQALKKEDDLAVSQLMIDTTMYKLDPRSPFADQSVVASAGKGAEARHAEFVDRYNKLSPEAREVYSEATDANRKLVRAQRRAGVDTAIAALDANLSEAQRGLLYGAKTAKVYDSLIGKGKLIDVGDNNEKLKSGLSDFAGFTEADGPYHHLGRQGDYVVSAEPEGTREFSTRDAAEAFAKQVTELSPNSRGKVVERAGKFAVDYKAQYVSMHETRREAELVREKMSAAGYDVGHVTQKTLNGDNAPLTHGMKEIVTEAERKIQKNGTDTGTEAMVASLRSAFLQMVAARSAYAGSQLARKNVAGVQAADMRTNFSQHAVSAGWHTAQLQTLFKRAEAMAKVRGLARDNMDEHASQGTMYRRGKLVEALNKHALNEVQTYGQKAPLNAMMAKLGFMNYLASLSHAGIWLTQNFTTGYWVGGARWGYGKSLAGFSKGMMASVSPAMKTRVQDVLRKGGTSEEIHQALLDQIAQHPTLGKWATGSNSHLRQLIDRGVISHGYADELSDLAKGPSIIGKFAHGYDHTVDRVFEWARLIPGMVDSFNRLSTALAGLEMTGGDIRKTSDFVQEIHADYSQANKPLAFKRISKIPGANSVTMFKTYAQEMIHLTYGNLIASFKGDNKAEAAKTLAGVIVGNMLFAGVYGAVALEPVKLAMYAYHKIADEEGDVWDFKNAVHRFLVDHFGKAAGNSLAGGPIPHLFNADVSSRMGLADLFFHNPPDLLTSDKDEWKNFIYEQGGPMVQYMADGVTKFMGRMQRGDTFQAMSGLVPIKQYQDSIKAFELYNTGKLNSLGVPLSPPSTGDAISQFIGFKPPDVAQAEEKQGVKIEYAHAAKLTKDSIVKQLVAAEPNSFDYKKAYARLERFNRNNPSVPITGRDINRLMRAKEMDAQGINRNQKVDEATNF